MEDILPRLAGALMAKHPGARCWSDDERFYVRWTTGTTQRLTPDEARKLTESIVAGEV